MYDPSKIQNKGSVPLGAAPINHPAACFCPQCGNKNAVAIADGTSATRVTVQCPNCGTFVWDTQSNRVVEPD